MYYTPSSYTIHAYMDPEGAGEGAGGMDPCLKNHKTKGFLAMLVRIP